MNEIFDKTMSLIESLEKSECVLKLTRAKEALLGDDEMISKIKSSQDLSDNELVNLRTEIYNNKNYADYQDGYNELFYIVKKINGLLKDIIDNKECWNESN